MIVCYLYTTGPLQTQMPSGGFEPPVFPLGRDRFNPLSYEGEEIAFLLPPPEL